MTDAQILTIAMAVIFPLSMLIYSNSRITDAKDGFSRSLNETKETLRAEMRTMEANLQLEFTKLNNKLDHLLEIVSKHDEKLGK